jgi:sugar/nucleoside kinase (ribokinase family)
MGRQMTVETITGVVCLGNICFDIPVWPVERVEWNQTVWVETITGSPGGNGANTSYTLATMEVPVRLIGSVGNDPRGDELIGILAGSRVDVSSVTRSPLPTTTTVAVIARNGDRSFLHRPGSSHDVSLEQVDVSSSLPAYSHFHFANPFALPKIRAYCGAIMLRAKEAGLTTSLDTGWDSQSRWMLDVGPALGNTDVLFVNEGELNQLGGLEQLRHSGAREIVVKRGPAGCSVYDLNGGHHFPAFEVAARDTTGAGDGFAGAYLAAIYHGLDRRQAAAFANATGALIVEQIGATTGVRSFAETLGWMAEREQGAAR